MTVVRIVKNWSEPDLMQQTPRNMGIWQQITFSIDALESCDYLIVLNQPAENMTVRCPRQHVWAIMQEPPNEFYGLNHRGDKSYWRVYTSNTSLVGKKYIYSQPCLAWHIQKSYDELVQADIPEKRKQLSWITSNIASFEGQRLRLSFLERIREDLEFDLFGRGFHYITDKWQGLAPYRYSLAVENFRNDTYWSEKISDCFLSWTMPIYYGCTKISDYFPKESLIQIDINDPNASEIIQDAIANQRWEKNLDAIEEARNLILQKYQLFPFVAGEIRKHESDGHASEPHERQVIRIPKNPRLPLSYAERVRYLARRYIPRPIRRVIFELRFALKDRLKKT